MAGKGRRRPKFRPFRMTERVQKAILVALCVFIMMIFAVPRSACLPQRTGGRDPGEVALRLDGRQVTFGELDSLRRRWTLVFGPLRGDQVLSDAEAIDILSRVHNARKLGIRIPDEQVLETIRDQLFPRRVTVEYIIAKHEEFDGSAEKAKAAIAEAREEIVGLVGPELRGAFERVASERELSHGKTRPFTHRTAHQALAQVREVPNMVERAYQMPVGQVSEPVTLADRALIFRVVRRTSGFGPDGYYYPQREGWVGEGYGVASTRPYDELLREQRLSQADLEQTVRESIAYDAVFRLYRNAVVGQTDPRLGMPDGSAIPSATLRDRYRRDHTQTVAAYFALDAADFSRAVTYTDEGLRTYYEQHKSIERAENRVGYLQPERVQIQYLVGKKSELAQALSERELRTFYQQNQADFEELYEEALPEVRSRLAELRLRRIMSELVAQAAQRANRGQDPDLPGLAASASQQAPGAFVCQTTEPFSARRAEKAVPNLSGGKLADKLFGESGEQYLIAGAEREEGDPRRFISPDFECDTGRFFFRVLRRTPSREVPYEDISPETRERLIQDLTASKAADAAQEKARDYRSGISAKALENLAHRLGVEPTETDYLLADSPLPGLNQPLPELYDQLAVAPGGRFSRFVQSGDRTLMARLIQREDVKGLKLQLLMFKTDEVSEETLGKAYQPAAYQQQARYEADPYRFLDKPKPIPFEKVKDDIAKLLARRRTRELAKERIQTGRDATSEAEAPDLAAAAKEHKLAFTDDVKVDLAKTEAAPQIGPAAGFHQAVTSLEPGEISSVLASAQGRFFFRLEARDETQATVDVVAALYDSLRSEVKVGDEAVRAYYDEHRDTAYVTDDEIREAPDWEKLGQAARKRVVQDLRERWSKKPLLERLNALRDSALFEAFRAYPSAHPLQTRRPIRLTVRTTGPFSPESPPAPFKKQPGLVKALDELQPGQLSQPLEARTGAILALLTERGEDGALDVAYVRIQSWDVDQAAPAEPDEAELRQYYQDHQDQFRVPDQLQIQYLAASYDDLAKTVKVSDQEVQEEYDRGVKERDTAYRDHTKLPDYVPLPLKKVRETAVRQVAHGKAQEKAKGLLAQAKAALEKQEGAPDFEAVAAKYPALEAGLSSFFQRDQRTVEPVGLAPELVEEAFAAEEDELIGPVFGLDGACLARRQEFRPAHVSPFEDVRAAVLADYRRREANRQALDAARRLRQRVASALEGAEDAAQAFRSAVEAKPLEVSAPKSVAADLISPFYPEGARMSQRNTGPAQHGEFVRAAFSLRPAQLSEVVFNDDRTTCYVLTPTHFLAPDEPAPFQLSRTRMAMARTTTGLLRAAWKAHLEEQIAREP